MSLPIECFKADMELHANLCDIRDTMAKDSYEELDDDIEAAKRLSVELMYARLAELRAPVPPPPLWMAGAIRSSREKSIS